MAAVHRSWHPVHVEVTRDDDSILVSVMVDIDRCGTSFEAGEPAHYGMADDGEMVELTKTERAHAHAKAAKAIAGWRVGMAAP